MRLSRIALALAAVAIALAWAPQAAAFHDSGVAYCAGCHTMHNSQNGAAMNGGTALGTTSLPVGQGYDYLLLEANRTDVCLRCHSIAGRSYNIWGTGVLTPLGSGAGHGAGDYVFLTEDNLNDGHRGSTSPIAGYAGGHNVVSIAKAIVADPMLTTAPGGTFPAADLACSSCHDPHGTSAFRLLYGADRLVAAPSAGGYMFTNDAPDAEGIALSSSVFESATNHTAYKGGMSAWCANCHGDFHQASGNLIHPSGEALGSSIANVYNKYNGTTDCVNNPGTGLLPCGTGTQATAYLAQVPFEDASMTIGSTAGPTGGSEVMCLTCHRAHATSARDAGRWDFSVTLLAEDGHESGAYALPNPYDENQRSLCNKCHMKDAWDHITVAPPPAP